MTKTMIKDTQESAKPQKSSQVEISEINKIKSFSQKQSQEKIKELEEALDEKTKLSEERLNQLKYMQADFDNYRKKFEKEKENITESANKNLIKELLVILDDFERAIQCLRNKSDKQGLLIIYKNFFKILENCGLKKIESLGKKFNPNYHEVILKEKSDKEDKTILKEIQKGYLLNSKVLRYSKVKIAENKKNNTKD